jgi:hypothetical protein
MHRYRVLMHISQLELRAINRWYNVYQNDLPIPDLFGRGPARASD